MCKGTLEQSISVWHIIRLENLFQTKVNLYRFMAIPKLAMKSLHKPPVVALYDMLFTCFC